jgi:hypothetical protein
VRPAPRRGVAGGAERQARSVVGAHRFLVPVHRSSTTPCQEWRISAKVHGLTKGVLYH